MGKEFALEGVIDKKTNKVVENGLFTYALREAADYKRDRVSEVQASRALRRTQTFVETIRRRERKDR